MLATVKRLVGAARGELPSYAPPELDREALEKPVTAARERSEAANREHEATMARAAEVAEQIKTAETAFDADGTDELADKIAQLKREMERRQLFSQRTQRAAIAAAGVLEVATKARDAAVLAHLEDRASGAPERLERLWRSKGAPLLVELAGVLNEAEAIINDANAASTQAHALKRSDAGVTHAHAMGINALRSLLSSWAKGAVSAQDAIRLERLIGR
jgi:hypothetical protein